MKRLLAPIMFVCLLLGCIVTASANPDPALDASPGQLIIDLGEQWADTEFSLETEVGPYPGKIVVSSEGVLTMEQTLSADQPRYYRYLYTASIPAVSFRLRFRCRAARSRLQCDPPAAYSPLSFWIAYLCRYFAVFLQKTQINGR